jgi:hypothetical protein
MVLEAKDNFDVISDIFKDKKCICHIPCTKNEEVVFTEIIKLFKNNRNKKILITRKQYVFMDEDTNLIFSRLCKYFYKKLFL